MTKLSSNPLNLLECHQRRAVTLDEMLPRLKTARQRLWEVKPFCHGVILTVTSLEGVKKTVNDDPCLVYPQTKIL